MKNLTYIADFSIGSILTSLIYLVGGFDIALKTLIIVIVLDYIAGVLSALYNKKLNSKIGFKGILKKLFYFCIVVLATLLDRLLGDTGAIRTLVIYFLVANDGLSIVENAAEMGIPLPKKLIEALEQLRKEDK